MAACILCGKSAGLFYSLHKNCYRQYDDSRRNIAQSIAKELGRLPSDVLADKIQQSIARCGFVEEAHNRTINRALEFYASNFLETNQPSPFLVQAWTALLEKLSPDASVFINQNFLIQQYNLHALQQLKNRQLPECNCHPANYSIQLRKQEVLWWCFDKSEIQEDVTEQNPQSWSVTMHLLDSLLKKNSKQVVNRSSLGSGKLLLTNQRIYFEGEDLTPSELEYPHIYSLTPVKEGIRIQPKHATSVALTYLCEDARLLFEFIQYARGKC